MTKGGRTEGRKGGMRLGVLAMTLVNVVWAACGRRDSTVIEASGTVEATEADLGFQVPGRIDSIFVAEGDKVPDGARLAVLGREELAAQAAAARAQLAAQRARLSELEHGFRSEEVGQARASLRSAEGRLDDALRDRQRTRNLFAGGAVSRQALDQAETGARVAEAERDRLAEQLRLLERGPRPEQIAAQRAVAAQAGALLRQAEAALGFAEITAPFSGILSRRHREPGEVVSAGTPVLALLNPDDRWIRIYVRQDLVGRLQLGAPAEIQIDAWPDRTYRGEVVFIADEAEFTPRSVQTREERVRLVYRVKVRVVGDTAQDLKPGLSADVRLGG